MRSPRGWPRLPGVRAVGGTSGLPLSGGSFNISFTVDGRPEPPPAQQPSLSVAIVTPGYFDAMGIGIARGRALTPGDVASAPPVVVLSEAAVRKHFPGEDPIGKHIRLGLGRGPGKPRVGGDVVGVARDVKRQALAKESAPEIYIAYAQYPVQSMSMVLRTDVPPRSIATAARARAPRARRPAAAVLRPHARGGRCPARSPSRASTRSCSAPSRAPRSSSRRSDSSA
jgi:hypothetical protein